VSQSSQSNALNQPSTVLDNENDEEYVNALRSAGFLRFGRESSSAIPSFPRNARTGQNGGAFLRFGRQIQQPSSGNFLRFGRQIQSRASNNFLRFGRQFQQPVSSNFLRFGKSGEFLRFG